MSKHDSIRTRLFFFLIVQLLVLLVAAAMVSAASQEPAPARGSALPGSAYSLPSAPTTPDSPNTLQATAATTLEVSILSSPWATLDNNDPTGDKRPVPQVFVVQAIVTNTGETAAEALSVTLDYSDPINNWMLLEGEDAVREFREPLGPGKTHQIYWFATYSTTVGASYQYTVTADAGNADPVSTSDNYFGNPEPGKTVKTLGALNTGSTGILSSTAEIVVGAAFTVTVEFDLSTSPERAIFSPVGNVDFDPGSYRLLATEVSFYDDMDALLDTVPDRLYLPVGSLSISATRALMAYTFVSYTPGDTRLCPYTTVGKSVTNKYGNDFCTDPTIIPITSTVSISLTKQVTALDIRQGESLTYTISYTNNGGEKLGNVWIWDDVDPGIGSIVSTSGAPDVLTEHRVAWYVNNVPPSGNPGSTGTFTFSVHVDGGGQDLADQTDVVNHAFFGIDPGLVPAEPALTSTVTTTVQAPAITIAKTDGLEDVWAGNPLTYTLRITNSGSITATGVVITDQLPSEVSVISAEPMTTTQSGQTLSWNLPDIPPQGGHQVMTIPVTVSPTVQDGTVLTNTMIAEYESEIGHVFATQTATDTTTARVPSFVSFTSASQSADESVGTMTVTLQLDHASIVDISIPFTLGGTATEGAGKDYTITASPVVIPAGSLTTTLTINVNDDLLYEDDETVVITMGTPTNAAKGSPDVHTATILDNDGANKPTASFTTASQSELEDVGTMTVTVQIDKVSGLDTTIPFTLGGTATEGVDQDYTITPSPVVIPEGSLTTTLTIDVNDDLLYEADETVVVTMGTPTHADKGSPDVHTATILDNDLPPTVAFTSSGQLGAEDVGTMTVTLQLDVVSGLDTTIPFTVGGTATEGVDQDYTITASPVVIPAGSLTTTIIIYVNDDNLTEDPETVIITMDTPTNATQGSPDIHTATILASLCTCGPDDYELDDEMLQARPLDVGVRQKHNFCDDASDWTYFTAKAGNTYTITTQAGEQDTGWRADTYLTLYDASGRLIAANDDYEGAEDYSSQIVWRAWVNGVYYLHTRNRAGLYGCKTVYDVWIEQLDGFLLFLPIVTRNYTAPTVVEQGLPPVTTESDLDLAMTMPDAEGVASPSGVITHTCQDAYEIDDTWWQAKPIEDGISQVHSFDSDPLRYAADKDWMWFDIQPGRTITFTVPSITNTQTLLELYHDPEDAPDAQSTDPRLVWTAPYGGRYYLSVSPSHDPPQVSFGCADTVGYKLLAELEPRWYLYLPIVTRQVGTP
jgi:uncharacterized repeat protein (TIGR01451 family)